MRSFSDAQTLPDRTEEQERYGLGQHRIIEICLEYVKAKQGRELLVSEVKGIFGDVEGIVIYLPKPLQNDMPITEWHALRLEV